MKCCIACEHFEYWVATGGYSDFTPGDPAQVLCMKGVVNFNDDFIEDALATAQTCPHYTLSELAIKHGWKVAGN